MARALVCASEGGVSVTEPGVRRSAPAPLPRTLAQLTDDAFLGVLFRDGESSRAAIAKTTGISKPTISESAQRLLAAGAILEVGQATGQRGRPTVLYDVNPRYGHALGVVLERNHVAVRAHDYKGDVVAEYRLDSDEDSLPAAVAEARTLVTRCAADAGSPRLATAVSVAAPVYPESATVRQLPDAPFTGTVTAFGPALGLCDDEPLRVDNDVNWATVAESRLGSMQDVGDFLYVYLGAGVGAGLFLSGRLHRGAGGIAGEIAFTRLASGQSLMRRLAASPIGTADGRSIDVVRARELLDNPGETVAALLADIAEVVVNVATVVDPGRVVLGGPLAETYSIATDLAERIRSSALTELAVTVSPLGHDAPLSGAAVAALELAREQPRG
jgi:predicted NBD/HSP70 family sugar kinase